MKKITTSKFSPSQKHFVLTNDRMIRTGLKKQLEKIYKKEANTKIIEELGITHGEARIDIAVVNGVIHGYELKSDLDTLTRLPNQIKIYNSVLDRVTLVVGKNHLHEAIKIVPEWWGVTVAKLVVGDKNISFYNIREAEQNPRPDSVSVAALLWRDEALKILEDINEAAGVRSKTRKVIYQRLTDTLDSQTLGQRVRECLRTRANWRSGLRCTRDGG
jgi:hypothetical protein